MSNLYFPQLTNGSLAQYPVTRRWSQAVTINSLQDGRAVTMTSPAPPRVSWELRYRGLSATEWEALETLFAAAEGRFGTFTFLDPTDNLLLWSEDLTTSAWTADPLLQVTKGLADPMGGSNAVTVTNGGQATQQLMQSLAAPSWFQYCFSVYLRTNGSSNVNLVRSSAGTELRQTVAVTSDWSRVQGSGILGGQEEEIHFGLELLSGTSVFVFGAQVEAQHSAGGYKLKSNRSGVYPKSRFDQDSLVQSTDSTGQHSTTIQITASY
jgi:hypothetical protein